MHSEFSLIGWFWEIQSDRDGRQIYYDYTTIGRDEGISKRYDKNWDAKGE